MRQAGDYTPEAPVCLEPANYNDILKRFEWRNPNYEDNQSLPAQLQRLAEKGIDAFLFTKYSAIPLADYVRGFYEVIGLPLPYLGSISVGSRSLPRTPKLLRTYISNEAQRLRPLLSDHEQICVVEEMTDTGRSLWYGYKIVEEAKRPKNPTHISGIAGSYYHMARHQDVDTMALTSAHADFLSEAGKHGAALLDADTPAVS